MATISQTLWNLFAFISILGLCADVKCSFSSDSNLEKMLAMENDLIQLTNYLVRQEATIHGDEDPHEIETVNSTIADTKAIHRKIAYKTRAYLSHPFNIFHLTKRLSEQWGTALKYILESDFCKSALEDRLKNVMENIPTEDDISEAARIIAKLQFYFDLDLDELARGRIRGQEPLEPVTPDDIFEIGRAVYEGEDYYNAIPWLQKATEIYKGLSSDAAAETGFNQSNTLSMVASSLYKLRRLSKAVKVLDDLSEIDPNNNRVQQTRAFYKDRIKQYGDIKGDPTRPKSKDKDFRIYERLCRGENLKSPKTEAKLKCFYHKTWKMFIRIKAETMNRKPLVLVLHDIADADTAEAVRYMGYDLMSKTAMKDDFRYSFPSVTVYDPSTWGWLDSLEARYTELEGLLYSPYLQSPFEVRNFDMGGTMENPQKLTKVKEGGEIILPRSKTRIPSRLGSAVFFYATKDYVGVCPTLLGSQWLSWRTIYEQPANYCRLTEADKHKDDY